MRCIAAVSAIAVTAWISAGSQAAAWGGAGHEAIAHVAEQMLCPSAQSAVRQLLQLEGHKSLADVSTWADAVKEQLGKRGPRHALVLPLNGGPFQLDRDCADRACVVPHMEAYIKTLADPQRDAKSRLKALKFITHLVGDLHQPFHGATDDSRRATAKGKMIRLHTYWDSGLFRAAGLEQIDLATMIRRRAREQPRILDPLQAERWAEESRDIVRDHILPHLGPKDVAQPEDNPTMLAYYVSIAISRMSQASTRLAILLNRSFGCR